MTDVERIATGLTKAQRDQLLHGLVGDAVSNQLARKGLAWKTSTHFDFRAAELRAGGWELRRTGLAVKAHLEAISDD